MPSFDFITGRSFRTCLESDYREMMQSLENASWKGAQVLAGSIVETLLLDFLTSTPNDDRKKDPLRMDLAEAIEVCKAEGVLSARTADLCSVVRSFRNLIHPGRSVRLKEPVPTKNTATVATTLVEIIVEEIAAARRKTMGLTAEQILTKIRTDENASLILKHLLDETSEPEKERLLLELIPPAHRHVSDIDEEEAWEEARRLAASYRVVLDSVPLEVQRKAVAVFVRVLKQEGGPYVDWFSKAFFRPTDIQFVDEASASMVRQYIFGRVGSMHSQETLTLVKGITPFLPIGDLERWLNPFMSAYASTRLDRATRDAVVDAFGLACIEMSDAFRKAIRAKVQERLEATKNERTQAEYQLMINEIDFW